MTAIKNPGNTEKSICRIVQFFCVDCFAAQVVLHALRWGQILGLAFVMHIAMPRHKRGPGGEGGPPRQLDASVAPLVVQATALLDASRWRGFEMVQCY